MTQLSILIPAYKATATLPKLVQRLLAQAGSRHDVEIVISPDDGESYETLLPLDSRIVFAPAGLKSGPGVARTRALVAARGDHVTWVDADDWIEDHYLDNLFTGLEHHRAFAVRPEYRECGHRVRGLEANILSASGLAGFYGSVPVVAPKAWLACFADVVAEDVIATMQVLHSNGGRLPVVNAGYHFLLNDDSFCAVHGATFTVAYQENLHNLKELCRQLTAPDLESSLRMLFESRLAMSTRFDEAIANDPGADYHRFVLGDLKKIPAPYSGPLGRWY